MSSFSSAPTARGVKFGRVALQPALCVGRFLLLFAVSAIAQAAVPAISNPSVLDVYHDPEARESGAYFSTAILASGDPTSFDATGLPAWCTVNKSTGIIFGNTQTPGIANVTLAATNADGTGTAALQIRCHPSAMMVKGDAGTFRVGDAIRFTVTFNSDVYATGRPRLKLAVGSADGAADYVSGSGTSVLHFAYAVREGDGSGTVMPTSLDLNGGAIREVNGVDARLTLPMRFFAAEARIEGPSATGREPATVTTQPLSRAVAAGSAATFGAGSNSAEATYQWQLNGVNVSQGTSASLTVTGADAASAGVYTAVLLENGTRVATSAPAVLGVTTTGKLIGAGAEVGANIRHPNGNIYDQVLLQGGAVAITANPGEVTRISFVDLSNDIVQVEFSGAGTLSLMLEGAGAPAAAIDYNQAGVNYVKGHARIVIAGANETTYVSVFSVGRANAVNQALFREGVDYDGVADIASLSILSANGKFGGVLAGNASFVASQGVAGILAPNVEFTQGITLGDISAANEATPVLLVGAASNVRVAGGDLLQANNLAVQVSGISQLRFVNGTTSHNELLPAQTIRGRLEENGADVTARAAVTSTQ